MPVVAASLAVTANVLLRAELGGPVGTSALVGLTVGLFVVAIGSWRLPTRWRRLTWIGLGAAVAFGAVAAGGLGYEVYKSRHELSGGFISAELGVSALEGGRFDEAADWFAEANTYLDAANERLDQPWAKLAGVVPVAAQHQRAVTDMSSAGADALQVVSTALDEIDLDALRPRDGRFDLEALAALDEPLTRVRNALADLRATSESSRSVWLVGRATYELDDFRRQRRRPTCRRSTRHWRRSARRRRCSAPTGRGPTSCCSRPPRSPVGLGGFVGSYAELRVEDGKLSLGQFDRAQDFDRRLVDTGVAVHDDDFLAQYGRFGYDADGTGRGLVGDAAFRNLAMSPDFPTVAAIAADLYAQATGTTVDGVVAMDPFVVTQLLRYTGPVFVPSLGRDLSPEEAQGFLLRDQYVQDVPDDQRADGLAEAASQAFSALLSGSLPDPITLARDLGSFTSQRRLLVWSSDGEEQELIEQVHISGEVPALAGADGWAFTVSNAGGSKIDTFLDRRAGYSATTDPATGVTSGTVTIELDNGAPVEGYPRYVIGNRIGQPEGTSTLWVTVYSALGLDELSVDGVVTGVEAGTEQGWNTYRFRVDIPSMASVRIEARLSGTVADPAAEVVTFTQPMERDVAPL